MKLISLVFLFSCATTLPPPAKEEEPVRTKPVDTSLPAGCKKPPKIVGMGKDLESLSLADELIIRQAIAACYQVDKHPCLETLIKEGEEYKILCTGPVRYRI